MKETGLMFKAPLVRAILEGRKTQTRRIIKNQPFDVSWSKRDHEIAYVTGRASQGDEADGLVAYTKHGGGTWCAKSPVGQPGDRIYVRETFNHFERNENFKEGCECFYRADGDCVDLQPWRPAIHMPKHAARIWLEITSVRVERLQDLSNEDAIAEGVNRISHGREGYYYSAIRDEQHPKNWNYPDDAFRELWDSTTGRPALPANKNSKRYARVKHWLDTHPDTTGWAANPWVWVIDFKTISTTGRPA
ncbi:hypothetical protein N5D37_05275 [Comamonas aquatica]|uniref:hypothetical protein n=1 Tax=Comamonas aquatica TaxID=225991 RepID=UPI00244C3833|nr:hypothetical protein [Comamonas aquatica]MDH1765119.1 hypothetical protein [Comamonas aquatica]